MKRVLTLPSAVDPLINFGLPCTVRLPGGRPGFLLPVSLDASWPGPCKGWTVGPSRRAAGTLSAVGCCSGLCKVSVGAIKVARSISAAVSSISPSSSALLMRSLRAALSVGSLHWWRSSAKLGPEEETGSASGRGVALGWNDRLGNSSRQVKRREGGSGGPSDHGRGKNPMYKRPERGEIQWFFQKKKEIRKETPLTFGLKQDAGQECAWVYWIKTALEKVVWERKIVQT
uniref:Uncharacterized protein n=1 Tax=Brassica campestris TaxID=3711 RepID=M4EET8_BRACM